ncbi:hypothetical protein AXG93_367s1010 [Marchantia polymorpha subsp. ruderalis]|uniref:Uncharacterized protein n=1 Tax=Marchantia polymorpha subsp. ruderalis TaxID=1480154 RepID=A0A176VXE3_MARPO|nr:hypothetical protein AXG93_367s1010 [Marchantia polymorpha subsp. ruderalis]
MEFNFGAFSRRSSDFGTNIFGDELITAHKFLALGLELLVGNDLSGGNGQKPEQGYRPSRWDEASVNQSYLTSFLVNFYHGMLWLTKSKEKRFPKEKESKEKRFPKEKEVLKLESDEESEEEEARARRPPEEHHEYQFEWRWSRWKKDLSDDRQRGRG